ncbi:MAG TPA: hypothetical protein VFP54_05505 [Acidimicrobiales bacterium]|nr:hypothetical protein [Acidimicrobiales bacterium]
MISPPRRDDLHPGPLPPLREQWRRLAWPARAAAVGIPVLVVAAALLVDVRAGVTVAVLVAGAGAASVVYVKNRTDRHNAAVARGEISVIADPHFRPATAGDLPAGRLAAAGGPEAAEIGRVVRFDGGWIVGRRHPKDVAVVVGDDGGWARFDPRTVTDLWAVAEYRAGRGRDG